MINIAKLLKDAPKGMKLYSPLFGEVNFVGIDKQSDYPINVTDYKGNGKSFTEFGVYFADQPDAECLLFSSKDCRTWEGWKIPKSHYGISNFHAGMPVLVRDGDNKKWLYTIFGMYNKDNKIYPFVVVDMRGYVQCIPFNNDTKHLLGTTDMPSEEYINW